jgi:hypothetical protein
VIFYRREVRAKVVLIALFVVCLSVFIWSPQVRNVFFYSIIFAGRDVYDFNDATSGRLVFFMEYQKLFLNHPFFGHGYVFSESFPLSVLLDFGLVGGVFVFFIGYVPFYFCKKLWIDRDNNFFASFIVIVLTYGFNSIFEQQTPFGPGAKNFFLWLVLGFVLKHTNRNLVAFNGIQKMSD